MPSRVITYGSIHPKPPKLEFHHSEIHPAENGGLTIKHFSRPAGMTDSYADQETSNAYGPNEHDAAMKDLHSMVCPGCTPPKDPKTEFNQAKKKVSDQILSFKKPH